MSIFLRLERQEDCQAAGFPISAICIEMHKTSPLNLPRPLKSSGWGEGLFGMSLVLWPPHLHWTLWRRLLCPIHFFLMIFGDKYNERNMYLIEVLHEELGGFDRADSVVNVKESQLSSFSPLFLVLRGPSVYSSITCSWIWQRTSSISPSHLRFTRVLRCRQIGILFKKVGTFQKTVFSCFQVHQVSNKSCIHTTR